MRKKEQEIRRGKIMNAESIVMLVVSAGLMVYLLYALLRPEKF
jgi:K+-transporting ATPase KdpF subunit